MSFTSILKFGGLLVALSLAACATTNKCPNNIGINPVYESGTCNPRIRNVYVADVISPELKGKFKDNPEIEVEWVGTVTENGTIIPGHFVILNASGRTLK